MADYTPATPQVRAAYVRAMRNTFIASVAEHEAEFDRWLAARDVRIAELEAVIEEAPHGQKCDWWYDKPCDCWKSLYRAAAEYRADEERNHG